MVEKIQKLQKFIDESRNIVFFGGAGVSTESGVPDFRSKDGLHQKAGSKKVYELHGTTLRNYCAWCKKEYPSDYLFEIDEAVPKCECGGMIRPDVTLYEEALSDTAVNGAISAIINADMLIIGGTSLRVYPAASYVRYFRGKHLVVINREELDVSLDPEADLFICGSLGEVFKEIKL